jgi:hypothetical protein
MFCSGFGMTAHQATEYDNLDKNNGATFVDLSTSIHCAPYAYRHHDTVD